MLDDEREFDRLIAGLQNGDETILREFYSRYGNALHGIAENHLVTAMRRRVDADEVVNSVFRTFFRRANEGQFHFDDGDRLWNLVCAITLTKVREKARFHLRQKRTIGREESGGSDETQLGRLQSAAAGGPTPAESAEFADEFQNLLASLDEEERQVVELKLQDCTNDEAAEKLGVSERTVRRILKRVQSRLESKWRT